MTDEFTELLLSTSLADSQIRNDRILSEQHIYAQGSETVTFKRHNYAPVPYRHAPPHPYRIHIAQKSSAFQCIGILVRSVALLHGCTNIVHWRISATRISALRESVYSSPPSFCSINKEKRSRPNIIVGP